LPVLFPVTSYKRFKLSSYDVMNKLSSQEHQKWEIINYAVVFDEFHSKSLVAVSIQIILSVLFPVTSYKRFKLSSYDVMNKLSSQEHHKWETINYAVFFAEIHSKSLVVVSIQIILSVLFPVTSYKRFKLSSYDVMNKLSSIAYEMHSKS